MRAFQTQQLATPLGKGSPFGTPFGTIQIAKAIQKYVSLKNQYLDEIAALHAVLEATERCGNAVKYLQCAWRVAMEKSNNAVLQNILSNAELVNPWTETATTTVLKRLRSLE